MTEIQVSNVGPVPNLVVPVQPGGTIIKGYCGKGKSIVLEAIGLGLGARDRGRVAPRSGTKRGEVDCLGVVLGINAARITRNGESTVASVEEFSVGDLIDPPLKDQEAKNRHGIKALLRLSGAEADPARFYHLAGSKEQFEKLVPPDALKSTDLVDMAAKVKRALEAHARNEEALAEREDAKAQAFRNAGDGLDMNTPCDFQVLQRRLEGASVLKGQLDEQAKAARQAKQAAEEARKQLAEMTGQTDSIAELEAAHNTAVQAEVEASNEMMNLERELQAAKTRYTSAVLTTQAQSRALEAARRAAKATEWAQKSIDAAADVYEPDDSDLAQAAEMVETARKAIETAAVVRAAKEKLAQAKAHQEAAAEHRKAAMRLRDAAKGTDDVLSQAVASTRYSVEEGVLMGRLPTNGQVPKPYFEMSDGERTMIAVAEKIERARAVEPDGERLAVVDMPQRVAQDLPPSVLNQLFREAARQNTCIITAMVDDGDLRAEVWSEEEGNANG